MTPFGGFGNFRRPLGSPAPNHPTPESIMLSRCSFRPRWILASALLALTLASACTSQRVAPPSSELAAVAPMLSVERFLQAANARDYDAMSRLFGTVDGPVQGERTTIELWMDTLARVLQHRDYRIVGESQVPGREHPTTRVGVDLTIGNEVVPNVAFHVVRTGEGRWMVQEIDIEAITNR